jgi:NAD(P)-dependent dehydrogenase (short-subunit alcohol dehydrogenase family)
MSAKRLSGKVAVVTGASKGIGAAIAKQLAEGAAMVVNYSSGKTNADKLVEEITAAGGKAIAVQANISKKAEIDRLFAETKKAFGKLDIRTVGRHYGKRYAQASRSADAARPHRTTARHRRSCGVPRVR